MSDAHIKIYTMEVCPYCVRAKALLKQRGLEFEEVLLDDSDDAAWEELYQRSKMKTAPQIFYGDKLIGGYTELAALDQKDGLTSIGAKR